MAERRMFAKTIIDSDAFLDMPLSTQALYFHLSMRADDEGFINNPRKIQRMIGATEDDMESLVVKKFIIPFESGVVVIKHWKIHNYIRSDRYKETVYHEEKAMLTVKENKAYSIDIPKTDQMTYQMTYQMDTQVRLGKDRLGKDKDKIVQHNDTKIVSEPSSSRINYQQIIDLYHSICVSYPKVKALSDARKKAIKARLNTYNIEDFEDLFKRAEASSFLKGSNNRNWTATFDWLIKDSNMAKVLDGNYDSREQIIQEQELTQSQKDGQRVIDYIEQCLREEREREE